MLTTLYRKRIAALAIQLAKDDPEVVKEVIARLRKSGEIEADDLVYLDEMRISVNVTGDFGNVTDFDQVLGCAGEIVGMGSICVG